MGAMMDRGKMVLVERWNLIHTRGEKNKLEADDEQSDL